ncbi:MAG: PHP domain-containing protein, partial [Saprospiraceae bacterium]|nr:PHP domain-containing protein [Saprospiraceae bacterium]
MNEPKGFVDLHVHTNFSDGTFSPVEAVSYALEQGLSAIAVTDHDSVDGIAPCIEAAQGSTLAIVSGIELSAEIDDFEIHLIGLCIAWDNPSFLAKLREIRQARFSRMQKMIEKLNALGIAITMDEVMAVGNAEGALGRLHLARALFLKGAVTSIKEAFDRFISRNKPCYVKRMIIPPQEAL